MKQKYESSSYSSYGRGWQLLSVGTVIVENCAGSNANVSWLNKRSRIYVYTRVYIYRPQSSGRAYNLPCSYTCRNFQARRVDVSISISFAMELWSKVNADTRARTARICCNWILIYTRDDVMLVIVLYSFSSQTQIHTLLYSCTALTIVTTYTI